MTTNNRGVPLGRNMVSKVDDEGDHSVGIIALVDAGRGGEMLWKYASMCSDDWRVSAN